MLDRIFRSGKYVNRGLVTDALSKELAASASMSPGSGTQWLAHRVIADVEMIALNLFGTVTYDSLGFGFGSKLGLSYTGLAIPSSASRVQRFERVHTAIVQEMHRMSPTFLRILGFTKDGAHSKPKIISILTGREYSYTDTEHIMCKVYACAILVHPSRTCSITKDRAHAHCWPLFESFAGAESALEEFETTWKFFNGGDSKDLKDYIRKHYPTDFNYQEFRWVDHVDEETLLTELQHDDDGLHPISESDESDSEASTDQESDFGDEDEDYF